MPARANAVPWLSCPTTPRKLTQLCYNRFSPEDVPGYGKKFSFRLRDCLGISRGGSGATDIEPEMENDVHRNRRSPVNRILSPGEYCCQVGFSGQFEMIGSSGIVVIMPDTAFNLPAMKNNSRDLSSTQIPAVLFQPAPGND